MSDWVILFASLALLGLVEFVRPARPVDQDRLKQRWTTNVLLYVSSIATAQLIAFAGLATIALWAARHNVGLLNLVALPAWAEVIAGVLVLDAVRYGWHVLQHHQPLLWRFHRVHHADPDVDVTTGLRFHPVDVVIDRLVDAAVIVALGLSVEAVSWFAILALVSNLWQHGNIRLPSVLEQRLRWLLVTPTMHIVHHSDDQPETDSNYSVVFSVWDRLFGTHRQAPALGLQDMRIGLDTHTPDSATSIRTMLSDPFRRVL